MMKALSPQKNNGVTEEGPPQKRRGLSSLGWDLKPLVKSKKHEQKEEKASWLASAPLRCRPARSEGHHSGGSPQCAA